MKLFLLRHADALNGTSDSLRPLSEKGEAQIEQIVSRIQPHFLSGLAQIWHSPYVRAEQTARKFAKLAGLGVPLFSTGGFTPCDDAEHSARQIIAVCQMGGDLMVVGHNPNLERLAALLVRGREDKPVVYFSNCSMLCLEMLNEPYTEDDFGEWIVREFLP